MSIQQRKQHMFGIIVLILMGVQIAVGLCWMIYNISPIPGFGDTGEYVILSETLALDKARTIGFPLLLRWIIFVADHIGIPFQSILYVLQIVLQFLSCFFMVHSISHFMECKLNVVIQMYITAFLTTIPMVTFLAFSVLTDSIANSMTLFF